MTPKEDPVRCRTHHVLATLRSSAPDSGCPGVATEQAELPHADRHPELFGGRVHPIPWCAGTAKNPLTEPPLRPILRRRYCVRVPEVLSPYATGDRCAELPR